jgi:hypothetical protein
MKILVVKDKYELLDYKKEILKLFRESYGQELSSEIWDWAYINNPFGNPYAALAFDDGLVAHYAVIPYPLIDKSWTKTKSFLSMTTMVAKSHRKYGLFTKLANLTYDELKKDGADFVMGFPNQMSAPGFRKRLEWEVLEPDVVVSVNRHELEKLISLDCLVEVEESYQLVANLSDSELRGWRLSKPGIKYSWRDGIAYKEYKGQIDVIYYESLELVKNLPLASVYNILLPADIVSDTRIISFEYMFGGLSLEKDFDPNRVRRQMCISDVF